MKEPTFEEIYQDVIEGDFAIFGNGHLHVNHAEYIAKLPKDPNWWIEGINYFKSIHDAYPHYAYRYFAECVPNEVRRHKEAALALIRFYPKHISELSAEMKADIDIGKALVELKSDPYHLQHLDPTLFCNKEFMMHVVNINGKAILHASHMIKDDNEVAFAALNQTREAFHSLSDRLKDICMDTENACTNLATHMRYDQLKSSISQSMTEKKSAKEELEEAVGQTGMKPLGKAKEIRNKI